jgi:hypothetical protein
MIETSVPSTQSEAEGSSQPNHALIKVDKGKGRASDVIDDEEQVMALILGPDENDDPSSISRALIRPAPSLNAPDVSDQQLVIPNALPQATSSATTSPRDILTELPLPAESHLARALNEAGLPETALLNKDGQLVPARDVASGSGEGLGRGDIEKAHRALIEKEVMAEQNDDRERTVPTWAYRVCRSASFLSSLFENFWADRLDTCIDEERFHVWSGCRR